MPYSDPAFDKIISSVVKQIEAKTLLDIGAGAGKYGELAREVSKKIKTTAIEIEKDYIKKFKLQKLYNKVLNLSAVELIQPKFYDTNFDIVMIGDTIEHLKKSDGIDLINFLVYRCKWIVLVFPHRYLQNSVEGYSSEAHISVWSEADFNSFERTKIFKKQTQRLVIIRGYLEPKITLKQIEATIKGE